MLLVYLAQNSNFEYLGIQFEVSESAAHNIFPYWLVILGKLLPATLLEQVKKKSDYELVKEILTQYELTVDSAEQPLERPSDQKEQKIYIR
ncbi:transposase family protein [Microcoleus sp. Pol12B4]|uniref:transposase family protein n=1 Tax=Microcoleus sp. Pol12B4 TaxID=3055395 RepID=UPI002FD3D043